MRSAPDPRETHPMSSTPSGIAEPSQKPTEIKLVSHSNLFYWWPVWFLAFFMAIWTYVEDHRLAILPSNTELTKLKSGSVFTDASTAKDVPAGSYLLQVVGTTQETDSLRQASALSSSNEQTPAGQKLQIFRPRVSQHASLGAIFVIGLLLTIVITNVPLRGLWSFVAIILVVLVCLVISLFSAWDTIFERLSNLHIYINMAGYLFIGTAVFVVWALAVFIFDQRSYIIFTPGQIKVCEHIGASVQAFNTVGVSLEKQRDDLFRHYILGFGSGDLIVRTSGAERHEIKMPNVLGIGWRLKTVEDMIKTLPSST